MVYQIVTMAAPIRRCSLSFRSFGPVAGAVHLALAVVAGLSCSPSPGLSRQRRAAFPARDVSGPDAGTESPESSDEPRTPAARAAGQATPSSRGRLTPGEARRYMVTLINRDRASQGLPPVELDDGAATLAAQAHAEDMARLGYLGHWGSDGSVPEQRYTEAGGVHMVLENALGFTDEQPRTLDPLPGIDPAQVERAEAQFFDEAPPNDGHRRNILRPAHRKVGIGVAQPVATRTELPVPCFVQEFVDDYGTYAPLPREAKRGETLRIEGVLTPPARPVGVGIARVADPQPLAPSELNRRRSYPVPKPQTTYWGHGFVTPVEVQITGPRFSLPLPLPDVPGFYEISVWARIGDAQDNAMVSLRTVRVR